MLSNRAIPCTPSPFPHGVPMSRLLEDNQLPDPSRLVVGQTIVIQYPERTYVVRSGDTLFLPSLRPTA